MSKIERIGATSPADILAAMAPDAQRIRTIVVVALLEDGTWCVRHSTAPQSIIDSAAVNLLKFVK